MWRDALLVAGKDLRIEARSRVATNQVAPFAVLVLILFAFALEPDQGTLARAAAGLFWVAVLFSAVLAIQRSQTVEGAEGTGDALRLSGLDPAGIFLGKAGALAVQLFALELVLGAGVFVLYGVDPGGYATLAATAAAATLGLAAAGTLYGALAAGSGVHETLLPLLLLPAVAPVLVAATRVSESALGTAVAATSTVDWMSLLGVLALVYVAFGVVAYGPLMEER